MKYFTFFLGLFYCSLAFSQVVFYETKISKKDSVTPFFCAPPSLQNIRTHLRPQPKMRFTSLLLNESITNDTIPASGKAVIQGKISDIKTGEELIYTNIIFYKNGVFAAGSSTDFNGDYLIKVDSGVYEVTVKYTGYPDLEIKDVTVIADQIKTLNIYIVQGDAVFGCGGYNWVTPLIEQDDTTSGLIITSDQIENQSCIEIRGIIGNSAGVSIKEF